jgi:quercetin dioxygenase-like cupin family protein
MGVSGDTQYNTPRRRVFPTFRGRDSRVALTASVSVVKHGDQPWTGNRAGSRLQRIVDPGGRVMGLGLYTQECAPGVGPASHTHEFEEVLTILDGTAEVWLDGQRQIVGPDTSIFVPVGAVHGFRNVGDGLLKLSIVIAALELRSTFIEPQIAE